MFMIINRIQKILVKLEFDKIKHIVDHCCCLFFISFLSFLSCFLLSCWVFEGLLTIYCFFSFPLGFFS